MRKESPYVTDSIIALKKAISENKYMTVSNIPENEILPKIKKKIRNNPNLALVRDFLKNFIETNDLRKTDGQSLDRWASYTGMGHQRHIAGSSNRLDDLAREAEHIEMEHMRSTKVINIIVDLINGNYIEETNEDPSIRYQAEAIYTALIDANLIMPQPQMISNMRRPGRSVKRSRKAKKSVKRSRKAKKSVKRSRKAKKSVKRSRKVRRSVKRSRKTQKR